MKRKTMITLLLLTVPFVMCGRSTAKASSSKEAAKILAESCAQKDSGAFEGILSNEFHAALEADIKKQKTSKAEFMDREIFKDLSVPMKNYEITREKKISETEIRLTYHFKGTDMRDLDISFLKENGFWFVKDIH